MRGLRLSKIEMLEQFKIAACCFRGGLELFPC